MFQKNSKAHLNFERTSLKPQRAINVDKRKKERERERERERDPEKNCGQL
jgi:hypothetical protein